MENNQTYILSSIFGSYLVHKNPTCFSRWSFRKAIMESIRKLSGEELLMSFSRSKTTGEIVLFFFDYKPDGILRTVQQDKNGVFIEVESV